MVVFQETHHPQAIAYHVASHCQGRYSLAELGRRLGPVSPAAVSHARNKMAARMKHDPELKRRIGKIVLFFKSELDKVKLED